MKIKILIVLSVLIMFFSCKKTTTINKNIKEETLTKLSEKEISKLNYIEFALDSRTEKIIKTPGWKAYYEVQDIITNVKKGNLSFFNDNSEAIAELLKALKNDIPSKLNQSATIARITALETKMYKLESLVNLSTTDKKELKSIIKEFFEAFSNLNFQMNKKIENEENIKAINSNKF